MTCIFDTGVLDDVEMPVEAKSIPTTNEEITLAQTLIQIKEAKPKVVTIAATTTTTRPKDKWVVVHRRWGLSLGKESLTKLPQRVFPSDMSLEKPIPSDMSLGKVPTCRQGNKLLL
ncbi:hypothetical protein Tco_0178581 [Tanacetum coccineum]